ncbi:hypothetical protein V6N13_024852 [Hibiscus sabdariffa]|uniref:Uncharacterized protein n=1 Tax=Hibiscus sabdariffa TaxID=183260 RepID=A0ABR2QGH6_9ROSI
MAQIQENWELKVDFELKMQHLEEELEKEWVARKGNNEVERYAGLDIEKQLRDYDNYTNNYERSVRGVNFDVYNPSGKFWEDTREGLLPYVMIKVADEPFTPVEEFLDASPKDAPHVSEVIEAVQKYPPQVDEVPEIGSKISLQIYKVPKGARSPL